MRQNFGHLYIFQFNFNKERDISCEHRVPFSSQHFVILVTSEGVNFSVSSEICQIQIWLKDKNFPPHPFNKQTINMEQFPFSQMNYSV